MQDCLRPGLEGDSLYAGSANGQLFAIKVR